jgi:hypothetical protein
MLAQPGRHHELPLLSLLAIRQVRSLWQGRVKEACFKVLFFLRFTLQDILG